MVQELDPLLPAELTTPPVTHLSQYPSPRDLATSLAGSDSQLVFLDMASARDEAMELLTCMVRMVPNILVVSLLADNDPDFIMRCLRSGASDFLLRPFSADQLEGAMTKLARIQPAGETGGKEPAKVFAVMPAKGACRATTLACNFAFQWKRLGAQRILLVDMDPLAGTMSFLLKIKSTYSFLDALQRSHELDADLWNAMVTPVNGVDVMLAPEMMAENPQDLHDPSPVLDYARHAYDVVVMDAGSVYGDWNLGQARIANELLLVTTNELPALQAAQRALSYLETNRIGRWKVRLVVNRYHRDIGLSRDVIGTALHTEVFDTLPSDYQAVQKALMDGKPVPSSTSFGQSVVQLANRLGGTVQGPKKSSALGGLLGFFKR